MLNGNVVESLTSIIGQGFQLGTSTSYGTNIPYTPSATTIGFKSKWGSSGTGDGQFRNPEQITRDASGNTYVADANNDRIQKLDSNGNYLGQFGVSGSGDGEFDYPSGVAVDNSGKIYVVDSSNHRVEIFDSSFNYLYQFGGYGSGDGEFNNPFNIALDSTGNIYVTDASNFRVQKFDNLGNYLGQFGTYGSGDGQFGYPLGIYVATNGNIFVVDEGNSRAEIFDSSFNYLTQFGGWGTGDGQFEYPYAITMDGSGKLYVSDEGPGQARIQIFDSSGNYLSQFGSYGSGDGQLRGPEGLATDSSGNVYVSDYYNENIQVFGPVPVYSTGPYSSEATGLTCGTAYHYSAYVTNAGGTYYGADQAFNTQGCPYVPSSTKPTSTVNPNPAPLVDLGIFTAIGRAASIKQPPSGILGSIYRFLQSLPRNIILLLPYLVLIFMLFIALLYAIEALNERLLALGYVRKARAKAQALADEKNLFGIIGTLSIGLQQSFKKQMGALVSIGLLNKFEQSAISNSVGEITKQTQKIEWSNPARIQTDRKSLGQGGWPKVAKNLLHPLLWGPIVLLGLLAAGIDAFYNAYGIAVVSSQDIRLQLIIVGICSLALALCWSRLIYSRNTRQNASGELSKAIIMMQAGANVLKQTAEKLNLQLDEINSTARKLKRKDKAREFNQLIKELNLLIASFGSIEALNAQAPGASGSTDLRRIIKLATDNNKQIIAQKKLSITTDIRNGIKVAVPATLMASLIVPSIESAIGLAEKNGKISVSLKPAGRKIKLLIESNGLALSKQMLHSLEEPIRSRKKRKP